MMLNELLDRQVESVEQSFIYGLPEWQIICIVVAALFVICCIADFGACLWIKRDDKRMVREHQRWYKAFLATPAGQEAKRRRRQERINRLSK